MWVALRGMSPQQHLTLSHKHVLRLIKFHYTFCASLVIFLMLLQMQFLFHFWISRIFVKGRGTEDSFSLHWLLPKWPQ